MRSEQRRRLGAPWYRGLHSQYPGRRARLSRALTSAEAIMEERTDSTGPTPLPGSDFGRLVRAVHRLTIAVWALVALLIVFSVIPWATYFFQSGVDTYSGAVTPQPQA